MAESRSLPPTPRKLASARRRGVVPRSGQPAQVATLLSALVLLGLGAGELVGRVQACFDLTWRAIAFGQDPGATGWSCAALLGEPLFALCSALMLVSAAVGLLEVGPLFATEALAARGGRLDPVAGMSRLLRGLGMPLITTVLKALALLGCAAWVLAEAPAVVGLIHAETGQAFELAARLGRRLAWGSALLLAAFAALDVLYQRHRWRGQLRMTPTELRRELREAAADPHGARRRERARVAGSGRPHHEHQGSH